MIKGNFIRITIIACLFCSCSEQKQGDLLEIPVDINQNNSLPLSEIAEEITAIELETTDESLINPDRIKRIIIFGNNVIVAELNKILIFNTDGKFIRSIGSRGQGPGDYNYVFTIAFDEKYEHLFIVSTGPDKIICYNISGNLVKEFVTHSILGSVVDINCINGEFLVIDQKMEGDDEIGRFISSAVYRLNENFQVIDNFTMHTTYLGDFTTFATLYFNIDFILKNKSAVYLYNSSNFLLLGPNPSKNILQDTLYCFEKNKIVPELKLKFKNDGIDGGGNRLIYLYNIYRSSRYIFSNYKNNQNKNDYFFCYDTKTGKGYNMQDGFMDDINGIDKPVVIRPFNLDTETFYYLHTHINPGDLEEPNPTLYIGRLKK